MGIEKIRVGWEMSTRWTDPPMILIFGIIGGAVFNIAYVVLAAMYLGLVYTPALVVLEYLWYNFIWMRAQPANTTKYITFNDAGMAKAYSNARIPMSTLYDAYIQGKVDFVGDVWVTLDQHRDKFVTYKLTWTMVKWLVLQLFPNAHNSSLKDVKSTTKEIAEHYDRGNDFFNAFMGPSMVYTSGVYRGDQSLEDAQFNKMSMICDKLMVKEGERFLDIGCGWGTLVRHAAREYGATAVGVTLSKEGAAWCNQKN